MIVKHTEALFVLTYAAFASTTYIVKIYEYDRQLSESENEIESIIQHLYSKVDAQGLPIFCLNIANLF